MSPAPPPAADSDPARQIIARSIEESARAAGMVPPRRDARLDQVADDIARTTPYARNPSFELVSFLLSHYGIVEPEPELLYGRVDVRYPRNIVEAMRPRLIELLRGVKNPRIGVGVAALGDDLSVVLAVQPQLFELRPLPRVLAPGLVAHVQGRLDNGFRLPQVIVTTTDGTVANLPVRGTGRFEAALTCRGDRRGVLQLEIAAETDRGPWVLANFPIFCGVEPPRRSPSLALDVSGSSEPAEVEAQMLALVNRDRTARGLWPVRLDRRLAEVARAHSREMASTGTVAHQSPRTGSVLERLQSARLQVAFVGENVARDFSAAAAERGLMSSPGHRSNIVDPRMTEVGIGVARGQDQGGVVPLFFTQIFTFGLQ
jgi:uncharacterized protein YkwD